MIFILISFVVKYLITFMIFDTLSSPKEIRQSFIFYVYLTLIPILFTYLLFYQHISPISSFILTVFSISLISFFYKDSIKMRLFTILISVIITGVAELLATVILVQLDVSTTYLDSNTNYAFSSVLILFSSFIMLILITLIKRTKRKEFSIWQKNLIYIYPITSIIIMILLVWTVFRETNMTIKYSLCFVIIILIFVSNVFLINIVRNMLNFELEKQHYSFLKKYITLKKEHQQDVAQEYHNLRKTRHDMKASYTHLLGLVQGKKMEECENVLLQLLENSQSQDRLVLTGYEGLDAVLSSKIQAAKDKGIAVESTIALLGKESLFVDEIDISFICANLLDNAIEATEISLINHPKIVFTVKYDTDLSCLRIYCENPTIHKSLEKTTKKDTQNHGFGLSTIQEIAEHYNGLANYNIMDGYFTIIVTLENISPREEQKNVKHYNL